MSKESPFPNDDLDPVSILQVDGNVLVNQQFNAGIQSYKDFWTCHRVIFAGGVELASHYCCDFSAGNCLRWVEYVLSCHNEDNGYQNQATGKLQKLLQLNAPICIHIAYFGLHEYTMLNQQIPHFDRILRFVAVHLADSVKGRIGRHFVAGDLHLLTFVNLVLPANYAPYSWRIGR